MMGRGGREQECNYLFTYLLPATAGGMRYSVGESVIYHEINVSIDFSHLVDLYILLDRLKFQQIL